MRSTTLRATRNVPLTLVSATWRTPGRHVPERLGLGEKTRVHCSHRNAGVADEQVDASEVWIDDFSETLHRFGVAYVRGEPPGRHRPGSRPVIATCAPTTTSACAIACPSPLVAPVTRARTASSSSFLGRLASRNVRSSGLSSLNG